MTDTLELHAASPDETAQAHRNVFELWGRGLSLEEHVRSRLVSPKHTLATWYVGCLDGRVVVSLAAYPLRFQIRGTNVPGIGIGSVYTLPDFRRRGFAEQLIGWVEAETHRAGGVLSLLYSDIKPEYYGKMGYQLCPSLTGWRDLNQPAAESTAKAQFRPIDPAAELDRLMRLYDGYHGAAPLAIARDRQYWHVLLRRCTDDRFFALQAADQDEWQGYVRVHNTGTDWRIHDYAWSADAVPTEDAARAFYLPLIHFAAAEGAQRIGGWLPEESATADLFGAAPRQIELTMFKSLAGEHPLDEGLLAAADRFCEIDHV